MSSSSAVKENAHRNSLTVAVEGCLHGELDKVYATIAEAELHGGEKVDLLIVCGDFQCIRNGTDLQALAVPPKYRQMNTFHQYLSGEKRAPVLTIFIGGNHEASNLLQSLYYGGWVAPNIYFLGFAGVVRFGGLRIAGVSGIFHSQHYRRGHYERPPYSEDTMRSVYHLREVEVYRMLLLSADRKRQQRNPIDIFISHDWPQGIWDYGDCRTLLKVKPYFREDMHSGKLGSPPLMGLLQQLQPSYWFAAHLHVKFAAVMPHLDMEADGGADEQAIPRQKQRTTKFLALDKVLPGRPFLQILSIPVSGCDREYKGERCLEYDAEWLAILRRSHNLLSTHPRDVAMPAELHPATDDEIAAINSHFASLPGGLIVPEMPEDCRHNIKSSCNGNLQTDRFLDLLGLPHIWTEPCTPLPSDQAISANICAAHALVDQNEIDIHQEDVHGKEDIEDMERPLKRTSSSNSNPVKDLCEIDLDDEDEN